jgi:phosphoribosylanthranilate isomerase
MIAGIRFKVCGLTSLVDVECADKCGADYLGFNLYPKSPRHVSLEQYRALTKNLPDRRKIAITVEPSLEELVAMKAAGFDAFQIHFVSDTPLDTIKGWSDLVTPESLWLAPKLPPEQDVPVEWLALAKTFLIDTFSKNEFGGSGKTGDWDKFARLQKNHPNNTWVIAGGISPENIGETLQKSEARFVDINSGVETAPGVKDHAKLKHFVVKLNEARG